MMGAMRSGMAKRRASSFYQAGSMGFGSLTAWVLVWLSARVSQGTLGWVAAGLIGLPTLAALLAPVQEEIATGTLGATARRVGSEFKATFWRWEALPYAACMLYPGASGSAIGLLPGIAHQYGVSGDNVAWINGLVGGLLVAAGSGVMALVKVRVRVPVLYMIVALINCVPLFLLMLGPERPVTYLVGVLGYLFSVGLCYAMFTMVVLEFLGASGKSGSARYSIINSMGNVPVLYMALVDGWGGDKWGGRGLAGAEGVVGGLGALVLLAYFLTVGRRRAGF
jgi:PAT family beta-lactamase induction signal transducer AmpG